MLEPGHYNYHCLPEPGLVFCFGFVSLGFFLSYTFIDFYVFFFSRCHGLTTLLFSYLIQNTALIDY